MNLTSGGGQVDSDELVGFCREYSASRARALTSADLLRSAGVELSITTNATSGNTAVTEVWLPDEWNGRVLGTGNGGYNGGGACAMDKDPASHGNEFASPEEQG